MKTNTEHKHKVENNACITNNKQPKKKFLTVHFLQFQSRENTYRMYKSVTGGELGNQ